MLAAALIHRLPHGTAIDVRDGRPTVASDAASNRLWQMRWTGDALEELRVWRPDRSIVTVRMRHADHPLFGRADGMLLEGTPAPWPLIAATRWHDPRSIPPIDRPAAIPSGAGTALMNVLATCAALRGTEALRYRGPYPTDALYETLLGSFEAPRDSDARIRFTADVQNRALVARMDEVPVDFKPAPHEWRFANDHYCLQWRESLERAYVDGRPFVRTDQPSGRVLRRDGSGWTATMMLAGEPWHQLAAFDPNGQAAGPPAPFPNETCELDGRGLPGGLAPLLAGVLADRAPELLATVIHEVLAEFALVWGPTQHALARVDVARRKIELHSVLGTRLLSIDPAAMLDQLLGALEPVVRRLAQSLLAERVEVP